MCGHFKNIKSKKNYKIKTVKIEVEKLGIQFTVSHEIKIIMAFASIRSLICKNINKQEKLKLL